MPIINYLISKNIKTTIASDGKALSYLQLEYPQLNSILLPSYRVSYKGNNVLSFIIRNSINVLSGIVSERKAAKTIVKSTKADLIISDSRFGFRHSDIPCYIISHQLTLLSLPKVIDFIANKINTYLLNSFDKCLIPDDQHQYSGQLSKNQNIDNSLEVGPLSRMNNYPLPIQYDIAVILSGPEPTRTNLELSLTNQLDGINRKLIIIRGTDRKYKGIECPYEMIDIANSQEVNDILMSSKLVISRSGYSSIMDYSATKSKAVLIPTPGQPEQEYLGQKLTSDPNFYLLEENELNSSDFNFHKFLNEILDNTCQ